MDMSTARLTSAAAPTTRNPHGQSDVSNSMVAAAISCRARDR